MALTNYGELQTAVGDFLNKSNLTARIPDFITLAGQRIYYGSGNEHDPRNTLYTEPVRAASMLTREDPTPSSGVISLPTRYLATARLRATTGSYAYTLDYIHPAAFSPYEHNTCEAKVYTILNNAIELGGSTSGLTFRHDYYQSFAAFSASSDTNALLTAAPGVWLYGALLEAAQYQQDDTQALRWWSMYSAIVRGLNRNAKEFGGGTLTMRVR